MLGPGAACKAKRSHNMGETFLTRTTRSNRSEEPTPDPDRANADAPSEARREAIRRLGKYATYTAPALIALLTATETALAS